MFDRSPLLVGIALVLGACSTSREELPAPLPVTPPLSPMIATSPDTTGLDSGRNVPGYAHNRVVSRIQYGGPTNVESAIGLTRHVGAEAASVTLANGYFAARPNANSPASRRPPRATNGIDHNKRVLDYFVTSGLPADQIGPVHANAMLELSGNTVTGESAKQLRGYVSVVDRQVDGVRVEGSYAWAQFNDKDDVVAEEVWWPELDGAILTKLASFRSRVNGAGSSYRAKLPVELQAKSGELVVRHARPLVDAWFVDVTLDFQDVDKHEIRRFTSAGDSWTHPSPGASPSDIKP